MPLLLRVVPSAYISRSTTRSNTAETMMQDLADSFANQYHERLARKHINFDHPSNSLYEPELGFSETQLARELFEIYLRMFSDEDLRKRMFILSFDKVAAAIPSLKDVRERIQQLKTDRLVRQAKHQVAIRRFEEKVGYPLRKVKESAGCMKQVTTTLISFHLRCLLNMGCSTVLEHLTSPSWELLVAGRTCAIGLKMSPVDHHPPPYDCSIPQQRAEGMWLSAHTARPEQIGNAVMSMFLDFWDPE
ncbi:hypothetical protein F5141DRAFT_1218559 [Pisolithus sp. B1]|nr:hypothetical protein F5141DRAFT_1218559 [Pisolithus sp. B1]